MKEDTNCYTTYDLFTGVNEGQKLLDRKFAGTATRTNVPGVYDLFLLSENKSHYLMAQTPNEVIKYDVYQGSTLESRETLTPCGSAQFDFRLQDYLQIKIEGSPDLYMDLFSMKEAA